MSVCIAKIIIYIWFINIFSLRHLLGVLKCIGVDKGGLLYFWHELHVIFQGYNFVTKQAIFSSFKSSGHEQ